ncbi:unnamed protein product [Nezara viridula]|uniref:Uncharacterized protein n=1 Tax=Nezara viridula TaxID=85310 RepID=A0A9P0MR93_NEZVI|nr:unnamed protein product [Nezara viridula]
MNLDHYMCIFLRVLKTEILLIQKSEV